MDNQGLGQAENWCGIQRDVPIHRSMVLFLDAIFFIPEVWRWGWNYTGHDLFPSPSITDRVSLSSPPPITNPPYPLLPFSTLYPILQNLSSHSPTISVAVFLFSFYAPKWVHLLSSLAASLSTCPAHSLSSRPTPLLDTRLVALYCEMHGLIFQLGSNGQLHQI